MFTPPPHRRDPESGFVLLAAVCLLVLLLISLAIAAPKVAQAIQRDKEMEAVHRGEQYRLAIKWYYQKFGAYPTSVKQLLNTNNMRFLRRQYKDPLTGKNDWKPILYGQAHVRPLGFFGKPLSAVGGIAAAGVGVSGGMYAVDSTTTGSSGSTASGSNSGGTNTSGSSGASTAGTGSSFGSSNSMGGSSFGSSPMGGSGFGSSPMGGSGFGSSPGGMGSMAGASAPGATGSTMGSSPMGGTSATTFGANGTGPIVGFTLPIKKPSLIDYMEQTAYNKWEFNYDPAADQMQQAVSLLGGGGNTMNSAGSATTANAFGNSGSSGAGSPFGSSNAGGFGSTSGPGASSSPMSSGPGSTSASPSSGFPQ